MSTPAHAPPPEIEVVAIVGAGFGGAFRDDTWTVRAANGETVIAKLGSANRRPLPSD